MSQTWTPGGMRKKKITRPDRTNQNGQFKNTFLDFSYQYTSNYTACLT